VKPVECRHAACNKLARFLVGDLAACGRHVTWALGWAGANDAPGTGVGKKEVVVRAHSGWEWAGQ
jgi:hypothetical protein